MALKTAIISNIKWLMQIAYKMHDREKYFDVIMVVHS
jgi:hypothetical protein